MPTTLERAVLSDYSQDYLRLPWNRRARPVSPHSLRLGDFRAIRLESRLYADKTRFLRPLEDKRFTILIRLRRFGKSCWCPAWNTTTTEDGLAEFEQVFRGTKIGQKSTEMRHNYVVLRLDFSAINDALETLEERFEEYCDIKMHGALRRNADLFPKRPCDGSLRPPP